MLEDKSPIVYFGPQPGAKRFLHFLVIIIVLALMVMFLVHAARLEQVVEKTTIEKKINEFNSVLMVLTMEHMISSQRKELIKYHHTNPFPLIMSRYTVTNYFGEVEGKLSLGEKGGWYYDLSENTVIYLTIDGEIVSYRMVHTHAGNDAEQAAMVNKDELGLLTLEKLLGDN